MKKYLLILAIGFSFVLCACKKTESVSTEEIEPTEGAPYVAEGQFIDEAPIADTDLAGRYNGINYPRCELSIYSYVDDGNVEVGNIVIYDDKDEPVYDGSINKMMDNFYEMSDRDVTISVYSDNGTINLDVFENGQHVDYFVMVEHFEP